MSLRLLRPLFVLVHVLVVLAVVVCLRFGLWQWGRGVDTGSVRNYSYGLEWWAFGVLTVAGWVKYCVDEVRDPEPDPVAPPVPAPQAVVAPAVAEQDDPELAAWNARFAELARRDADRS